VQWRIKIESARASQGTAGFPFQLSNALLDKAAHLIHHFSLCHSAGGLEARMDGLGRSMVSRTTGTEIRISVFTD
jgi:hypothetical protein